MKTTASLVLCSALALFLLAIPAARATDPALRVTVAGKTSGPCGESWSNPCGLQYALTTVAASGNELWVAAGTYTPTNVSNRTVSFRLRNGIGLYGGFAMTETLRTQRNIAVNVTILSGDIAGENSYHVVVGSGTNSSAILDGFMVTGGNADGSGSTMQGGGMFNSSGNPTVANVTFSGNRAYQGGGMYNDHSNPILTNVTFSGNSFQRGGGVFNYYSSPSLTNVTFSQNWANSDGGGITNNYSSSPALTNVTFWGNYTTWTDPSFPGSGGAMSSDDSSSAVVRDSIFWGNSAARGAQVHGSATIEDAVVQGGCPDGSTCTHIVTADPLLGNLGLWGGGTQTIRLAAGSSAVDEGNDATCAVVDQRGKPRVERCDLGAFEFQGYALAKTGGDSQSTLVNTTFGQPLEVTLTEVDTGLPVAGIDILFGAPTSGASAAWNSSTGVIAITSSSGVAAVDPPTANGLAGAFTIGAAASFPLSPPRATASTAFILRNTLAGTGTTISSSANPSVRGQTVTLTASVSGAAPGGTITFKDGSVTLSGCNSVVLSGGTAACTLASPAPGIHDITASYSGDTTNNPSTGAFNLVVNKANTATVITSSGNPVLASRPVTLTVTVSPVAPASGVPAGSVTLYETTATSTAARETRHALASQLLVNGAAAFGMPRLTKAAYRMLAIYDGDTDYQPSASTIYVQNVDLFYYYFPFMPF